MNRDETAAELRRRGYSPSLAVLAVAMAAGSGFHALHRHTVTRIADGEYRISPRPWEGDGTGQRTPAVTDEADILDQAVEILGRRFHESVTQDRVTAGTAHAWVRYAAQALRLNPGLGEDTGEARSRVPGAAPFPPESGMTGQDAIDNGIIG